MDDKLCDGSLNVLREAYIDKKPRNLTSEGKQIRLLLKHIKAVENKTESSSLLKKYSLSPCA